MNLTYIICIKYRVHIILLVKLILKNVLLFVHNYNNKANYTGIMKLNLQLEYTV